MRDNSPPRFLIDENLSPQIARSLSALEIDVRHVTEIMELPAGAPDEDVIRYCGEHRLCLITRDLRVRKNIAEKEALKRHGVGAFFIGGKNRSGLEIVRQVVNSWERIVELAEKEPRPFAFMIRPQGGKLERLTLD